MNWLFLISFLATVAEITSYIEKAMHEYYNSEFVKESEKIWRPHMISFQTSIGIAIQQSYGFKGLNVYVKRPANPLFITKGYYHTDNQVHVILEDLFLDSYPAIFDVRIVFALTRNALKLDALVSKIILHSDYTLIRNATDVVYDAPEQNVYEVSPFLFEQVQRVGQLAIQVDGCKISGVAVVSLSGSSVNLGNALFALSKCNFNFEIFSQGAQGPPVIANYLPFSGGIPLERLIMKTMESELVPKLQAALTSYVNTSAIFDQRLREMRSAEETIFESLQNYLNNVVRNMNVLTINKNLGKHVVSQKSRISCKEMVEGQLVDIAYTLYDISVTGLETVYSTHTGGPLKLTTLKISEELRYETLQVRGSIDIQVGPMTKGMFEFAVEINDVAVDLVVDIKGPPFDEKSRYLHTLEFKGWRDYQFSCPGHYNRSGESYIAGFLLARLPLYLTEHLSAIVEEAAAETDNEYKSVYDKTNDKSQTKPVKTDVPKDLETAEADDIPVCKDPHDSKKVYVLQESTQSSAEQLSRMKKMRINQQEQRLQRQGKKATRTTAMSGNDVQEEIPLRNIAENEVQKN